jgi:hypothetical protein
MIVTRYFSSMTKTILGLSCIVVGAVVAVSTSSCSSANSFADGLEGGAACTPDDTEKCSGPDDCVGGQVCGPDGTWGECSCQNDAGEIDVDGSLVHIGGGGGTAGKGGGGSGGSAGTGSGGTDGSGGAAGKGGSSGSSGTSGSGGTTGKGGSSGSGGTTGKGGSSGSGGTSGKGGSSGSGGTSGKGGSSGSGGTSGKGGSSGSGGTSGKGGSSGSGGTSGKGGSSGSGGSSGKGGSGGSGGYAFRLPRLPGNVERRHAVTLAEGASETTQFIWRDSAGLAPPADLWVEAAGRPVLQVSSVGAHPFVRAGLEVVPIVANEPYNLVIERSGAFLQLTLVRATEGGATLLQARIHAGGDERTADNTAPRADVVLPPTVWRASVSMEE